MKKPEPPCLGCPDRTIGCHTKCLKYADYVRRAEIWRKYLQDQKLVEVYKNESSCRFMKYWSKR